MYLFCDQLFIESLLLLKNSTVLTPSSIHIPGAKYSTDLGALSVIQSKAFQYHCALLVCTT
jgi:hypothetical protein